MTRVKESGRTATLSSAKSVAPPQRPADYCAELLFVLLAVAKNALLSGG